MNHDEERQYHEKVLAGAAPPKLGRAATCGRLAELYLETPQFATAEKALALTEEGLTMVGASDPLRPKLLHFQAMALRCCRQDDASAMMQAAQLDREAWTTSLHGAPQEASFFARQWADWAWSIGLWNEAGEAYSKAHGALKRFMLNHVDFTERLKVTANMEFATRGSYALAKDGKVQESLLLLEGASDLMFSGLRQMRELDNLERANYDLASGIRSLSIKQRLIHKDREFDQTGNISAEESSISSDLESLVRKARKISGFENFAAPPDWSVVELAASNLPLIYLVPTDKGSCCHLVAPEDEQCRVTTFWFDITSRDILDRLLPFLGAEYGETGGDRRAELESLLEWQGAQFLFHIKLALQKSGRGDSRVGLLPFGIFGLLPIHTGFIRSEDGSRMRFPLHPAQVAYLFSARNAVGAELPLSDKTAGTALVVDNPQPIPPQFDPLLLSCFEAALIARHFQSTVLSERDATIERVSELFSTVDLVHFSCHGAVDRDLNFCSVLLLANNCKFSYEQLLLISALSTKLVVLSACSSGVPASAVEYVVSLPSALLSRGVGAVLGTHWHTDEVAALVLFTRFYELWQNQHCEPHMALAKAQEFLMSATAGEIQELLPPEALKSEAAESLVNAEPAETLYSHPWYWAGFFFAGL